MILHGLLGSSRNWRWIGKSLARDFNVFALDLRNHGNSPSAESMNFSELVEDVRLFIHQRNMGKVVMMGHSLGGKVAMRLACRFSTEVEALIVVDVSPKPYPILHRKIFQVMASIDASKLTSRAEADQLLEPIIAHQRLQKFIVSNLARDPGGQFRWQVDHETLARNQETLAQNPLQKNDRYDGPVLFIRGEYSPFLKESDLPVISCHFPNVSLTAIPESGHNPHVDNKSDFLTAVHKFREKILADLQ